MGGLFGGGGSGPSMPPTQILQGVRLQSSLFGQPKPILYGQHRLSGNIIWYGDFVAIAQTSQGGVGGKGGGGGASGPTTYQYAANLAVGLCEGPIAGVISAWQGKNRVYGIGRLGGGVQAIFTGDAGQLPWSFLSAAHPDQALNYPGLAHIDATAADLGNNATLPNYSWEVKGLQPYTAAGDANPKDIIYDFLTNAKHGALFPAAQIGDMTQFSNYCVANGIFLSALLSQQKSAAEWIAQWLKACNSTVIYSDGLLKFIPYGDEAVTGNGVTYTPSLTPAYDLDDDAFIRDGSGDPVTVIRKAQSDSYNSVRVEFASRGNFYNPEIAEARDQANIEEFGLRPAQAETMHEICDGSVARQVAQMILQRGLYIRNTYQFQLPWTYARLEPMDVVTLTDPALGLVREPVRITQIEEDEFGRLSVTAEELPIGVAAAAQYAQQAASGYSADYNVSPGDVNIPVIFEAPDRLAARGLEIWIAVSGGANWGGCDVWVSDDNATYKQIGTIHGGARHGMLTSALPAAADPDAVNTLAVDISASGGQLYGGARADADAFNTLSYVDGELVSFETAMLTAAGKYNLGYLRRGAYGTAIAAHAAGSAFARLDSAIFKYPFAADRIGKPVYIKFASFNIFGGARQTLDVLQPYTYRVTGAALNSPLPDVSGLASVFSGTRAMLNWQAVSDFRTPIDYEVRLGASWTAGKVLGRTPLLQFPTQGDGTYWVAAHYLSADGVNAYSAVPASVVIAGATLVQNVIAQYDEAVTGWVGAKTNAAVVNGALQLTGAGNYLASANILAESDIIWMGGVATSGEYDFPAGHAVNVGRVAPCQVWVNLTLSADNIHDNILTLVDYLAASDLLDATLAQFVTVRPQIAVAQADGIYGAWQDLIPGTYVGQYFKGRLLLSTGNPELFPIVLDAVFSVDVPDRVDSYTDLAIAAAGQSILYSSPFNGGSGGNALPNVQITILNAQAGDDAVLSAQTLSGCTVQVVNGGAGVARHINAIIQGY